MDKKLPAVRLATAADVNEIVKIYDHARGFMYSYGNVTQWPDDAYPGRCSAMEDLKNGVLYVTQKEEQLTGTFVMMPGPDATYAVIEDGSWRGDTPYGVIHRVASRGGGVLAALAFAKTRFDHIRMDTHADNAPMRHLLEKNGFSHRGTIYVENGTPRMAYDLLKEG